MSKYYLSKNTAKPVVVDGRTYRIEPADLFEPTHSWWGVIQSTDEQTETDLDYAVATGYLTQIDKKTYDEYQVKKKKAPVSQNSIDFGVKLNYKGAQYSGRPAEVVEDPVPVDEPTVPGLEETEEEVLTPRATKKGKK